VGVSVPIFRLAFLAGLFYARSPANPAERASLPRRLQCRIGAFPFPAHSEESLRVHGIVELVVSGALTSLSWQAVRLVRVVLAYRLRCKELELRREQLGLPVRQPAPPAKARRVRRHRG
jgi:hypothetical protein